MPETVQINGQTYDLSTLTDEARDILSKLRAADRRLRQLKADVDMISIARRAYVSALVDKLPHVPPSHAAVN